MTNKAGELFRCLSALSSKLPVRDIGRNAGDADFSEKFLFGAYGHHVGVRGQKISHNRRVEVDLAGNVHKDAMIANITPIMEERTEQQFYAWPLSQECAPTSRTRT